MLKQLVLVFAVLRLLTFDASAYSVGAYERPPQYIAIAFDNCNEPEVWKMVRDYSNELKAQSVSAKFTFFLSGVYFVAQSNKALYSGPAFPPCLEKCADGSPDCARKCHGAGSTSIGWAPNLSYIKSRIQHINGALSEGHEMGSHAVSHWSGKAWTFAEWNTELKSWFTIVLDAAKFNHATEQEVPKINLTRDDVKGFRAPYLDFNTDMQRALADNGFHYDTSDTAPMSNWPTRLSNGVWSFPLAELPVRNRGRKVLSMDYNFYFMQTKDTTVTDQHRLLEFEDEMYDTYMNYFWTNYAGNRAPLNIGHHFTQYSGGAYWRALKRFASEVCGKPEVRCVTYTTMMNDLQKLEKAFPGILREYQRTHFERYVPASLSFQTYADKVRSPANVSREELRHHACPESLPQL